MNKRRTRTVDDVSDKTGKQGRKQQRRHASSPHSMDDEWFEYIDEFDDDIPKFKGDSE